MSFNNRRVSDTPTIACKKFLYCKFCDMHNAMWLLSDNGVDFLIHFDQVKDAGVVCVSPQNES